VLVQFLETYIELAVLNHISDSAW